MSDDGLDGLLSQEDIDALTAGLLDDIGTDDSSSGSGVDTASIEPFIKIFNDQMLNVFTTTFFGRTIELKAGDVAEASTVQSGELVDFLAAKVNISQGINGDVTLFISKKQTALLSDLMLMEEEESPYEDEHADALKEIVNQIFGSLVTRLGDEKSISVQNSQTDIVEFATDSDTLSEEGSVIVKADLEIQDKPTYTLYIHLNKEMADGVISAFGSGDNSSVEDDVSAALADIEAASPDGGDSGPTLSHTPPPTPPPMQSPGGNMGGGGGGLFDSTGNRVLDLLLDVPLNITIELGRAQMSIRKILEMGPGSILEMDRFSGEPVDLLVNGKVVARGEVVVVDENFGIRIVSLVTPEERLKFLK